MFRILSIAFLGFWLSAKPAVAQERRSQLVPRTDELAIELWAREPMLKNPVAIALDRNGRLYTVEAARRGTVDIDIRAHKTWVLDDLDNQSIADIRDFFRRRMAPELSDQNQSWLQDRNGDGSHDWRDLMTVKETVRVLEDTDNDGKADASHVIYEGFNEEINGVIAGVMPFRDDVLVTIYPDLWRLRDTDGDWKADEVESVFRGFGVHAAFDGHDIHGLTRGPDGKLYFSVGDNGFSVVNKEGTRLHYPNTGGVLRMNPDFSELEVFAYGLRNVQEIAFDTYGNLFSVDNDGDLADERERFVYIPEGSDAGWRFNWQLRGPGWTQYTQQPDYNPWIDEEMWIPHHEDQPAHITPPLSNYSIGPGSFKFNPGTALSEKYQDYFFLIQFPGATVSAFQATPQGAGFKMVNEHTFQPGLMATALNFGPDGALYIGDWDGYWNPNDYGAIYKVDDPVRAQSQERRATQALLASGMAERPRNTVISYLEHPDQRVRLDAQWELAARGELDALFEVATDTKRPPVARVHALWGLAQNELETEIPDWIQRWPQDAEDPNVRAQAARAAGDLGWASFAPLLRAALEDGDERVVMQAGAALGKCGSVNDIPSLVLALARNQNRDPFVRHGLTMGLIGIGDIESLAQLNNHASSAVRRAAVVALRRLRSDAIALYLNDSDPNVRRDAARGIHDDFSIPSALDALAVIIEAEPTLSDEVIVRRSLSANLRLGGAKNARRLIRYALRDDAPIEFRLESLECLADWYNAPFVDRVVGRARELGPRRPSAADDLIIDHAETLLNDPNAEVGKTTTRILRERNLQVDPAIFLAWTRSENYSPAARIEALRALEALDAPELDQALNAGLNSKQSALQSVAIEILGARRPDQLVEFAQRSGTTADLQLQRSLLGALSQLESPKAASWIAAQLRSLLDKTLPPELALDVVAAAKELESQDMRRLLQEFENGYSKEDPIGWRIIASTGGDPARGEELFNGSVAGQCARCHVAGGAENQVGPQLNDIGSRVDNEYLLEALIAPGATIAPGYQLATISLADGRVEYGTLRSETDATVTLQKANGGSETFDKSSIDRIDKVTVSSMPPMLGILTLEEIRDIVAYLSESI